MNSIQALAQRYERLHTQLQKLTAETGDVTARLSTVAALLHHKMPHFSWTGFYLLRDGDLVVGPYQGSLACLVLAKNQGVCWAGVNQGQTIVVPDVHKFPGHIACDSRSRSEIVVPLRDRTGRIWGVLDVDSTRSEAFTETDRLGLEKIVSLL